MAFESNQMHLNQMQVQMQMSTIQMQVQMQMRPPRGIQMQVQMQMPHLHLQVQMHLHLNTSLILTDPGTTSNGAISDESRAYVLVVQRMRKQDIENKFVRNYHGRVRCSEHTLNAAV